MEETKKVKANEVRYLVVPKISDIFHKASTVCKLL